MPTRLLQKVLIADHDRDRAKALVCFFRDYYEVERPRTVSSFHKLKTRCSDARYDAVLVADGLPGEPRLAECLWHVSGANPRAVLVAIVENEIFSGGPSHCIKLMLPRGPRLDLDTVFGKLSAHLRPPPALPRIVRGYGNDRILCDQVRSLDGEGSIDRGERCIRRMLRDIGDCQSVKLYRLGQGFSGARVFRAKVRLGGGNPGNYVLKLSKGEDVKRVKNECDNYGGIEGALTKERYDRHVPGIVVPRFRDDSGSSFVSQGGYLGVAYDFLGDDLGDFVDLQQVYAPSMTDSRKLASKGFNPRGEPDLAMRFLGELFRCLWEHPWYSAGQVGTLSLWEKQDAQHKGVPQLPPYQLTGRTKARIEQSLSQLNPLGQRVLAGWTKLGCVALQCVKNGLKPCATAPIQLPVVVSPVHGDLNSNNILFWLEEAGRPFLIDFACYQPLGHTMQDFAKLEAEVKFRLMDRDAPKKQLPAMDLSPCQLPLWCAAEDVLASDTWAEDPVLHDVEGSWPGTVHRASKLVQFIRRQAQEVHDSVHRNFDKTTPDEADFMTEYMVALLYHTLGAIAYEDLSPFKRLLAVYSASNILTLLDRL